MLDKPGVGRLAIGLGHDVEHIERGGARDLTDEVALGGGVCTNARHVPHGEYRSRAYGSTELLANIDYYTGFPRRLLEGGWIRHIRGPITLYHVDSETPYQLLGRHPP